MEYTQIKKEFLINMEMNPLYPIIGISGIIILNFVALYFFIMAIAKSSPFGRFMGIGALVIVCALRFVVIFNNVDIGNQVIDGELQLEDIRAPTNEERINYYSQTIVYALAAWMFYLAAIYGLFILDNRVTRKDEKL